MMVHSHGQNTLLLCILMEINLVLCHQQSQLSQLKSMNVLMLPQNLQHLKSPLNTVHSTGCKLKMELSLVRKYGAISQSLMLKAISINSKEKWDSSTPTSFQSSFQFNNQKQFNHYSSSRIKRNQRKQLTGIHLKMCLNLKTQLSNTLHSTAIYQLRSQLSSLVPSFSLPISNLCNTSHPQSMMNKI